MGNAPICHYSENDEILPHDLNLLREFRHEYLGDLCEMEKLSTMEKLFMKNIQINKRIHDIDIQYLKKRCLIGHPNLLKILGFSFAQDQDQNISKTKISIYFEPFVRSLAEDIRARKAKKTKYTEVELLLYLKSLVDVLAYLQEYGFPHGNISPDTIFFGEDNQIKIADSTLLSSAQLPGLLKLDVNLMGKYIAPENLTTNKDEQPIKNHYKNDVFALGMTFLEAGLLEDVSKCYISETTFDYEKLLGLFSNLYGIYTGSFPNILKFMLAGVESERPDWIQLRNDFFTISEDRTPYKQVMRISASGTSTPAKGINQIILKTLPDSMYRTPKPKLPKTGYTEAATNGGGRLASNRSSVIGKNGSSMLDIGCCGDISTNMTPEKIVPINDYSPKAADLKNLRKQLKFRSPSQITSKSNTQSPFFSEQNSIALHEEKPKKAALNPNIPEQTNFQQIYNPYLSSPIIEVRFGSVYDPIEHYGARGPAGHLKESNTPTTPKEQNTPTPKERSKPTTPRDKTPTTPVSKKSINVYDSSYFYKYDMSRIPVTMSLSNEKTRMIANQYDEETRKKLVRNIIEEFKARGQVPEFTSPNRDIKNESYDSLDRMISNLKRSHYFNPFRPYPEELQERGSHKSGQTPKSVDSLHIKKFSLDNYYSIGV